MTNTIMFAQENPNGAIGVVKPAGGSKPPRRRAFGKDVTNSHNVMGSKYGRKEMGRPLTKKTASKFSHIRSPKPVMKRSLVHRDNKKPPTRACKPINKNQLPAGQSGPSKSGFRKAKIQPIGKTADDIDARDQHNPNCVTEYAEEMYDHFRKEETRVVSYLHNQPCISEDFRAILVDWLISAHLQFRLSPETLYLAIVILDRYLSKMVVKASDLQLIGAASLFVASKYEDIYFVALDDLAASSDFSAGDILDMETKILKTLDYRISVPTAHVFLTRFARAAHADKVTMETASFFLEGTLVSYALQRKYKPSQLAAASVFLARHHAVGYNSSWSVTLEKYAGYKESEITQVARDVLCVKAACHASKLNAVHKKYTVGFGGVAQKTFECDF